MMVIVDIPQHGQDWHTWRMAGVGGSDIYAMLENSPFEDASRKNLWLEKTGRLNRGENYPMRMGRAWEPIVRDWYQKHSGIDCRPLCVQHDDHDWMHASLDGWTDDGRERDGIVVEIKCPSAAVHAESIAGRIVEYYLAQVQWQLLVTGAKECRYVSYYGHDRPGRKPKFHESLKFVEVRVLPDTGIQNSLYRIAREFWIAVLAYWASQRVPARVA